MKSVMTFLFMAMMAMAAPRDRIQFEFIEVPGAATTMARGINRAGDISGTYSAENATGKGFIRKADGTFTTIEVPGAFVTNAWGIDDLGRVVGWFFDDVSDPFAPPAGFLYHNGQYTRLEYPGANGTQAYGVSAAGVTGYFYAGGHYHGFLYKDGTWTQLDVPGATDTFPFGIAPNGQVVGIWNDPQNGHRGFIYTAGAYTTLDYPRPGTYASTLYAINGAGSILGHVSNGGCDPQAFIFSRTGKFTLLDLPGSFITGINDSGLVVGIFGTGGKGFVAKASSFAIK